ncbi:Hypothetical protein PBC10988_17340 [Planctomycetales bacterium 10988]|nr:Hypothetical protein PBC10988_17340 [Planctomycetales bacterium 10988]
MLPVAWRKPGISMIASLLVHAGMLGAMVCLPPQVLLFVRSELVPPQYSVASGEASVLALAGAFSSSDPFVEEEIEEVSIEEIAEVTMLSPPHQPIAEPEPLPAAPLPILDKLPTWESAPQAKQLKTPAESPSKPFVRSQPLSRPEENLASIKSAFSQEEVAVAEVDHLPQKLPKNISPIYPNDAWQAGKEGIVLIRALISDRGLVDWLKLEESSGTTSLDLAALQTVRQWRFEPARQGDRRISYEVIIPVRFSLQ